MSDLYPLKFFPIFKEKIWGGQKIKDILEKDFGEMDNCGESWEISGVDGSVSIVSNGALKGKSLTNIIESFGAEILGQKIIDRFGIEFPLLIKFIDAAQDLSIQVHPDDELAIERHNCHGKSEMWYILQSDDGASLVSGFNRKVSRDEFKTLINEKNLEEILNKESANKNDVFHLPAGRIHTIGAGILLAEIQQTSDITYRIYDFDRVDKNGNKRELHIEEALEAIDFNFHEEYKTQYSDKPNTTNRIVATPYFTTNKLKIDRPLEIDRSDLDCFKIYIAAGGNGRVAGESIQFGEVILMPANLRKYTIEPDDHLELIETYIEL